jgi:hypothetical protein
VRAIVFGLIVCFIAFDVAAHAQEGRPPREMYVIPGQTVVTDAVTLAVIGATPPGKKDLTRTLEFPKNMPRDEAIDACAAELAEFLKHRFPAQLELIGRAATCVVPEVMDEPS